MAGEVRKARRRRGRRPNPADKAINLLNAIEPAQWRLLIYVNSIQIAIIINCYG